MYRVCGSRKEGNLSPLYTYVYTCIRTSSHPHILTMPCEKKSKHIEEPTRTSPAKKLQTRKNPPSI